MNTVDKFNALYKDNTMIFNKVSTITSDYNVFAKVYDNMPLFCLYFRSKCAKYSLPDNALFDLQSNSILMYFADIDLYGLFTPDNYTRFCSSVHDKNTDNAQDDLDELKVNIYQLVLAEQKQKLVFICTNVSYHEKMIGYARECFGAKSIRSQNEEITVDLAFNGNDDIISAYDKLYDYIRIHGDNTCCSVMKQPSLLKTRGHSYRKYSCNDTVNTYTIDALISALRSATINAPIVIGNNNTIGNNNNINIPGDIEKLAVDWINSNPPHNSEPTADYYKKYIDNNRGGLTIQKFTKVVTGAGYKKLHGKVNYWSVY